MYPSPQIHKGEGGVVGAQGLLKLDGDFKKTEKKVTWISDVPLDASGGLGLVPLVLRDYDFLITKPKLEEGDDFEAVVNQNTLWESKASGEPAMRNLQTGDIIQLERKGFFRVDSPLQMNGDAMVLVAIPDGKPKSRGVSS